MPPRLINTPDRRREPRTVTVTRPDARYKP
jgi:hypothetical protein